MNSKEVSGQIIGTFKIQHILNETSRPDSGLSVGKRYTCTLWKGAAVTEFVGATVLIIQC